MANLSMSKLLSVRFFVVTFVGVSLVSALFAQTQRLLQVEVEPNQRISILANDVSYGEVLRALQKKIGWEIEIPALADELRISHVRVEAKQPSAALAQLLEGSRLGYALLTGENQSQNVKVVVTPRNPGDASVPEQSFNALAIPDEAATGALSPTSAQALGTTPTKPKAATGTDTEQPESLPTRPLAEAVNAMGVPVGVSLADVGHATTMPLTDAASMLGVPPGLSSADVGSATTLPLSGAAKMMGVPPGASPDDVGKTTTLPVATGPGKRP